MAGRNVGSIEVTVEANTGKLKAQIVKASEASAQAAREIFDEALDNIRVKLDTDAAATLAEIERVRTLIEAELSGIPIGIDVSDARRTLRTFTAEVEANDLALHAEISERDLGQINLRIRELQEASERHAIELRIDGDLTRLNASIERFRVEQERGRVVDINFGADLTEINARIAALRAEAERDAINLRIEGDLDRVNASLETFRHQQEHRRVDLSVGADVRNAVAAIEALLTQVEHTEANPNVGLDLARAEATIAAFRELQERDDIEIPVNVDVDALEARVKRLGASGGGFFSAGEEGGKNFGGGFARGLSLQERLIVAAVVTLLEPATVAVEGLAGGLVQVLGSAFSALAGTIGAAAPIVAGLGATFASIGIASIGVVKGISAINKEMNAAAAEGRAFSLESEAVRKALAGLGPAAQGVVKAVGGLLPQFKALQDIIAEQVFEGLGEQLNSLARDVIPNISTSLAQAGQSANRFLVGLADAIREIDFAGTFAELQPAVDAVGRAVLSLIRIFEPFIRAATPAALQLAAGFERAAQALLNLVRSGQQSGALTNFLVEGVASLKIWLDLIGGIGKALFGLFQAGKAGGDQMIARLGGIVDKFNEWMNTTRGQDALARFFQTSQQILADMLPLLEGAAGFFRNMITADSLSRFESLATSLGNILPVLGSVLELLQRAGLVEHFAELLSMVADAVERAMPALQGLADVVNNTLAGALQAISPLVEGMGVALSALAQFLQPLAPFIIGVATAFATWKAVAAIVDVVKAALTGLAGAAPELLILAAAAGAAFTVFQLWGRGQKEVAARAEEVSDALDTQITSMLETATAATAAQLGLDALAKTLANTGEDGEKLSKSLGTLGKSMDDSLNVLLSFGTSGENARAALTELAHSAGLTGSAVADLVEKVASSDKPFFGVSESNRILAQRLGITTDQLALIGNALEEVQDQAAKTDLDQMIQDFLAMDSATSEASQGMLKQAEAQTGLSRTGKDLLPLYEAYTTLLAQSAAGQNEAAASQGNLTAEQQAALATSDALRGSIEATLGPLGELGTSSDEAATGLSKLGDFRGVPNASLKGIKLLNTEFEDLIVNAEKADNRASGFASTMDSLVAPSRDVQSAFIDLQQAIADAAEATKAEEFVKTLDVATEAGRENSQVLIDMAEKTQAWGEAQLRAGASAETVNAGMAMARQSLIEAAKAFGASDEQATNLANTLLGIPPVTEAAVTTPGLAESTTAVADLGTQIVEFPTSASTTFTTPGAAESVTAAEGVATAVSGVDGMIAAPQINVDTAQATTAIADTQTGLANLSVLAPKVVISADNTPAQGAIDATATGLASLSLLAPNVVISSNAPEQQAAVEALGTSLVQLPQPPEIVFRTSLQELDTAKQDIMLLGAAVAETVPTIPIRADDQATPVINGVRASVTDLSAMGASPTVSVTGADTALGSLGNVREAVTDLSGQTAAPRVSVSGAEESNSKVQGVRSNIEGLSATTASPKITLPTYTTNIFQLAAVATGLNQLDRINATPDITIATGGPLSSISSVQGALNRLSNTTATPSVSVGGVSSALGQLQNVANKADSLDGKVVDITIVTHNKTQQLASGGVAGPFGAIGGEAGPELATFRGVTSLITSPTMLAPGTIVTPLPSASGVVGGQPQQIAQKVVNNYLTINTPVDDPELVAVQVTNRLAAMANV